MSVRSRGVPKAAILFLTHLWSAAQVANFLRLQRATRRRFDLFLLVDGDDPEVVARWRADLARAGLAERIVAFGKAATEQRLGYPSFRNGDMAGGSMHFPVVAFAKDHPQYREFWLIEFDVHVASWGWFLRSFERCQADLLFCHLERYDAKPRWPHWKSLKAPAGRQIAWQGGAGAIPLRGFFPIYRISARALACIDAGHAAGWEGHCEVVIPTLLREHGLAMEDFNDYGRFYVDDWSSRVAGGPPQATLRWRPPIDPATVNPLRRRRIYHPLKV